jgi:ubiquinone/menaquinone biosynthesis C-methylase UbiE
MNTKLLKTFEKVEKNHWWWAGRRQLLKQLLEKQPPQHLLDMGCGTGQTLLFLKKQFPRSTLHGIDFSPLAVSLAKGHKLKNIRRGRGEKLPYQNNSFDTVLMLDVIEHIKDDLAAVKEAKRVLKPGGKLIITTPALQFIWSDHDSNQGHYRRYTRRQMRSLARRAGLRISFVSYFNFFLSPLIIAVRLIGNLAPFKKLTSYDSKLNYGVASQTLVNTVLTQLFVGEVYLLNWIRYPIGISIASVFVKSRRLK